MNIHNMHGNHLIIVIDKWWKSGHGISYFYNLFSQSCTEGQNTVSMELEGNG